MKPLVEKTADSIIKFIKSNELITGDKLPNEYMLAEKMCVGRSTLRESVRSLAVRNILEVRQGSGTYVSKNMGITEDPFGFVFIKNKKKLTKDLFALRYILEPEVAMLAAQKRTADQMRNLEEIALNIETSIETTDQLHFELDIEFHSIIAKMSQNIAMNHLIPVVNQSIHLYNSYYTNEQSKTDTVEAHRKIVDSIREQNVIQARHAMQSHIANNQKQLMLNLHSDEKRQLL